MDEMIKSDIERIDSEISKGNNASAKKLQEEIVNTYKSEIPYIDNNLSYDIPNYIDEGYYSYGDYVKNLNTIKRRLELFFLKKQEEINTGSEIANYNQVNPLINITNNTNSSSDNHSINTSSNSNNAAIDIKVMFEEAKKSIDEIDNITTQEYDEIITKINELEELHQSEEKPRKKWDKCKEMMKWLCEKGSKVASVILPLITETIK